MTCRIEPILLRPHHLTCLFFYVGKGYSEAFTRRMDEISDRVRSAGNHIRLVEGCDVLCEVCPHRGSTGCKDEWRMGRFDERTIAEYGLVRGTIYEASKLFASMFERFDSRRFERICGDCDWRVKGVCDPDNPPKWAQ
ncbi:MAG: DUF1284 domain-containing protein [Myxococcales bacterium]|jgi:hypothetical protein|nr:DUF1284 domain-containing protein [Myxococcales bacterium]